MFLWLYGWAQRHFRARGLAVYLSSSLTPSLTHTSSSRSPKRSGSKRHTQFVQLKSQDQVKRGGVLASTSLHPIPDLGLTPSLMSQTADLWIACNTHHLSWTCRRRQVNGKGYGFIESLGLEKTCKTIKYNLWPSTIILSLECYGDALFVTGMYSSACLVSQYCEFFSSSVYVIRN